MDRIHKKIRVRGIVQGVGFRPFIYNLALEKNISGLVLNDTEGVLIEAEGHMSDVDSFIHDITGRAPALAVITEVSVSEGSFEGYSDFTIHKSQMADDRTAFFSPDVAVCSDCLREFNDPEDRRYHYPFITCINCGPRFSIVSDIPYDRENTSMKNFSLCTECGREYMDSADRRFHAQPVACPECGPVLSMYSIDGTFISSDTDSIAAETVRLIKEGKIIAIKGMGGYLLAADACSDQAVALLRSRKRRPFKPFAVMAGSLEKVRSLAYVSPEEEKLLVSKERPIVLLKIRKSTISPLTGPGLSHTGIMLPYMPFHHLLFSMDPDMVLIMTSGNLSEEPIVYTDDRAFSGFKNIADYIITYNREILSQNDDSVMFVEMGRPYFIRRSRGFVPTPFLSSPTDRCILAAGGDLKNSFAFSRKNFTIVGQYLGDMIHPKTQEAFKRTLDHFIHTFNAEPDVIVSDMHPGYMTKIYADELAASGKKRILVQHHHAHIASVIEEYSLEGHVLGIAFDGTGYGTDGTLWGSEFLVCDRSDFTRACCFSGFLLPGGEKAIRDVWKIGLSLMYSAYGRNVPFMADEPLAGPLFEIMEKKIGCPETCSIGRLFDGMSSVLGLCRTVSTEAQAAVLIEEAASAGSWNEDPFIIPVRNGKISTEDLVRFICSLSAEKKYSVNDIALAFHLSIAYTAAETAENICRENGLDRIVLSGGCFHNRILLRTLVSLLESRGLKVYTSAILPFNDGCISFGQTAVAKEILKKQGL